MMKRICVAMILTAALASCDGSPSGSDKPAAAATHDPMEAKIDALSPSLQQTTMFRAIRDGGYTCQKIVRMEKHAPIDGKATWIAECDDHGQYVIALQPGGIFWVSGVPQPKKR
ncbi:MAG: hypothetical protein ACRCS5_01005 [Sphingomonas sp.]|jgi:hypothetical protein|uniref:hypothetical protein n=2 Tax=unclassified Sphingomonas TaxID=196159 RepID=UPI000F85E6E2|nr:MULTISPECIES: hypothetical protein [unclassified Sphingomonas]MDR6849866.1 hypothetical protein [Sphingomonas sp. BE137]MDR7257367.1 hypothetical protein [Sphingomonas sp. BE270]RUN78109.1 hypothetical protein EJC47_01925 [Sphingomonas sp. TF3]